MAESTRLLDIEEEIEGDSQGTPDLVFCRIGNPVSLKPTGSAFDLSDPPSQPLAVSERHGLLFLAHSEGFFVSNTRDVIGIAKEDKEKGSGQCIQNSSIVDVQIGRVSILALSGDSSMLSATVGGEIHLFYVRSLLEKVQEPAFSRLLNESGIIKDLRWRKSSENSFIVLSSHGSLFHGSSSFQLKDVMNNVDAVDWSLDGNYVAIARKDFVSILSSDFKEKISMSLLFQSWPSDPDSEIKVDSIKWVRQDSIIIGCIQLKDDGSEDGYLVQIITSGEHKFTEESCKPVVFTFPDFFEGLSVDMFPSGVGSYFLSEYLDCWDVAVASNKKNVDQHISFLRWLIEDNRYEVVSLELGSDRYIPRIDLQDDGDDNLILGLGLDKVSLYEKIQIQHGAEFKVLSPRCILLFLTCDGKLTLYYAAWVSEPSDLPKMTSPYGDIVVTEKLHTSSPIENIVVGTTSRLKDELNTSVSGKKQFSPSKPDIGVDGKMECHGKFDGMKPRSHPGTPVIASSDSTRLSIQVLSTPSTAGYIGANSTIHGMPSGSSTIKGTATCKTVGSSITMGSLSGSHAVWKPFEPEGSNASASTTGNGTGISKSVGLTSTVGYPFQLQNVKPVATDASRAKHLLSSTGESASTGIGHKMLFSPSSNSDLPTFSKPFRTLSPETISQGSLNTTSVKLGHSESASIPHSSQVSASSKLLVSRQQHPLSNTTISKPRQILEAEPEFSKQFYNVKEMAMELDSLLSSIECEGGFKDRCTIIQENLLLGLEAGLCNLSETARVYRSKVEDQLRDVQQLHIKMFQVSARQVYMEGIVKQASDRRYREIWNRQKLSPEFEAKRLHILNLKLDLSNQLIELERHFNRLEINRFGEYDLTCPGRRVVGRSLAPSRQTQSLHSVYSTVNSQLAAAEQLSECLSKQMAVLNITLPTSKKQNATKELFQSIGLDPESDAFKSPDLKGTKIMPYSSKRTSLSSSSSLKERSWKSSSCNVRSFEQDSTRRKRDSLDRTWGYFEPSRTIIKRTLKEEPSRSNLDTPFKVAKEVFDCQVEAFDNAQKTRASNLHRASTDAFISEAQAFDITKWTSNGAAWSTSKMTSTNPHYLEYSTSKGIQVNSSKQTIEAQPKSMFKWANDHSDLHSDPNATLSSHSSQVFHRDSTQTSSLASPLIYTNSSSSNKDENFGSPFMFNMGSSFTMNHSSSAAIKTAPASKPASNAQFGASISTQMRLSSSVSPVKAASTARQLSQEASQKSVVDRTENLVAPSENLSASITQAAATLSSSSSLSSVQFVKSLLPHTFSSPSTSYTPSLFSNEVNFKYEPSLANVPVTEGSAVMNKTSSELELATTKSANNPDVGTPEKVLSYPSDHGSSELEADTSPASITATFPPIQEVGLHMSTSLSMGTSDTKDSKLQHIISQTPATTLAHFSEKDSNLPSISNESGLPAASGSPPKAESVMASSSIMTTEKDESLDANVSQEDEMEEEALDTNSVLNLESLGGFAVGSTPSSNTPKPNPFGSLFASANTGSASSPVSWSASPGQLFRPPSFNLPASQPQPSQLTGTSSLTGSLSGGLSGFGQPAQLGAGQQALGLVLGSFGQSRQLGAGMSGFGLPTTGFSGAGNGGYFANAGGFTGAATGGGFAAAASGGGGFAAAASAGGGFAAVASAGGGFSGVSSGGGFNAGGFGAFSSTKGGGFSAFGGGNSSAGRPPAELLMQMRK